MTREEIVRELTTQFPKPAERDPSVSPIRGGRSQALPKLDEAELSRYAFTRNYLDGQVTGLSPYVRHGALTLAEVRDHAFLNAKHPFQVSKFIVELAWRDYYQRLYEKLGERVWEDQEPYKTGHSPADYAEELPADISAGQTGLACMDAFARGLRESGYLHNHARMWLAAYVVHWRRVKWQAGARWFLSHLLDGDPASNNLSWQWVASTFSHKPYFFNRENLEKYTEGAYCKVCAKHGCCDFEGSYQEIGERLFSIHVEAA